MKNLLRNLLRFILATLDELAICWSNFALFYVHNMVKKLTVNCVFQVFCRLCLFVANFWHYCFDNNLVSLSLFIINWTSENNINEKFFLTSTKKIKYQNNFMAIKIDLPQGPAAFFIDSICWEKKKRFGVSL